ncbi:MAG: MmcQ/YjbR family DNA-binding protein [Actinobacteria bacterium]|nr:MmcQ/YjbR family DNA-binding protein [Actinomycetota bacterium]
MSGEELRLWAAARADELPGTTVDQPFGPEVDVYRVRERMFMAMSSTGRTSVTLKSAPEDAEALRETFEAIVPGYHMNKRHWITLQADGTLEQDLVEELVTEAYRLVVAKLPRAQRPVDPDLFLSASRADPDRP